jgi:hypothetical protein
MSRDTAPADHRTTSQGPGEGRAAAPDGGELRRLVARRGGMVGASYRTRGLLVRPACSEACCGVGSPDPLLRRRGGCFLGVMLMMTGKRADMASTR